MYKKNICKFPIPEKESGLTVHRFVLESNPESVTESLTLDCNRIILINKGDGKFIINGKDLPFVGGMLIFTFSGEELLVKPNCGCTYTYIDFSGTRGDELLRRFEINKINRAFSGFDGLIPLWNESLSRADANNVDLAAESILLYTFSRITSKCSEDISLINSVVQILDENFADPTLQVTDIAKELSYNPKYISHLFKGKMGLSYTEYLKSLRIKHAISLFDRGLDSIKNVAFLSGYSDPLYFSSVFKKTLGVSPKEYIVSLKNKRS